MAVKKSRKYNPRTHLAARFNDPERRKHARVDADKIARYLAEHYGAEVFGIGSLFDEHRRMAPLDHDFPPRCETMVERDYGLPQVVKNSIRVIYASSNWAQPPFRLQAPVMPFSDVVKECAVRAMFRSR